MVAALDGVKVLDVTRVLAGPWCTMTLADLGAEVWKIENPAGGDDTRSWTPHSVEGISTYFLSANRNKKSVAVDLKTPQGRAVARTRGGGAPLQTAAWPVALRIHRARRSAWFHRDARWRLRPRSGRHHQQPS